MVLNGMERIGEISSRRIGELSRSRVRDSAYKIRRYY